jgi:hypothetical protein
MILKISFFRNYLICLCIESYTLLVFEESSYLLLIQNKHTEIIN